VERLIDTCLAHIGAPAERITSAIYAAMAAHRGRAAVADDATILVVKRD
jgi:serine phosphatase RsbU (regulator of sigma subunit)